MEIKEQWIPYLLYWGDNEKYDDIDPYDTYNIEPVEDSVYMKYRKFDRVTGRFKCFKRILIPEVVMIPTLTVPTAEYYGTYSRKTITITGSFVFRVVGLYEPTPTTQEKTQMECKTLGRLYWGM